MHNDKRALYDRARSMLTSLSHVADVAGGMQMETALDASNRGFRMLQKMGWKQGAGLGKHEQGPPCWPFPPFV